jgi:hypothetical protein
MIWSVFADALVIAHLGFTAFVVFGGFLTWRWPRAAFAHLPALGWGIWVEASNSICPLTPLENNLRIRGGEAGYSGGFLAHYLGDILYPASLTSYVQWLLAVLLIGLNVFTYGYLIVRKSRTGGRFP